MATYTENYSFLKPEAEDIYNIAEYGETLDAIDEALAEAEETTAAILEQLNAGGSEKVYSPTETVQFSETGFSTTSGYTTYKLMHFTAKYSGSILLHLKQTTSASSMSNNHTLSCYHTVDKQYLDLENFTKIADLDYTKGEKYQTYNLKYSVEDVNIILPVTKGVTYYFDLYLNSISSFKLSKTEICYDVISDGDISEFN